MGVGNHSATLLPALLAALLAAACDDAGEGAGNAAGAVTGERRLDVPLGRGNVVNQASPNAATWLAQPRFANVDFERGELLSLACVVCHTLGSGQEHLAGPNLHGVFGRPAASAEGFQYSQALREAGIVWTPDALDSWLAEPDGFVPGNLMVFAGIDSDSDRSDLLAYLLRETAPDEVRQQE